MDEWVSLQELMRMVGFDNEEAAKETVQTMIEKGEVEEKNGKYRVSPNFDTEGFLDEIEHKMRVKPILDLAESEAKKIQDIILKDIMNDPEANKLFSKNIIDDVKFEESGDYQISLSEAGVDLRKMLDKKGIDFERLMAYMVKDGIHKQFAKNIIIDCPIMQGDRRYSL